MSRRRKKLLILLVVFLGITIIRETGSIKMSLFSSSISSMTSSSEWNIVTDVRDVSLQEIKDNSIKTCPAFSSPKDVPIYVTCMGYTIGQVSREGRTDACSPKRIGIDDVDVGPIWMPLFKYGSYSGNLPVHLVFSICRKNGDKIKYCTYKMNVDLQLSGTLRVTGFCSYREAKQMVANAIVKSAYSAIRGKLDELE